MQEICKPGIVTKGIDGVGPTSNGDKNSLRLIFTLVCVGSGFLFLWRSAMWKVTSDLFNERRFTSISS